MTDCPNAEIRDLLPDLVHDSLAGDDRQRVEQHLAGCTDCSAELALLRRTRAALVRRAPHVDAARIVAALPARRAPSRIHATAWRIAATIGMIALGTTSWMLLGPEGGRTTDSSQVIASATETPSLSFSGRLSALDDEDLQQLLADIETFDGVMPEEPRAVLPVWDGGGQ
jgi:anti-sigma factor RsiW